MCRCSVLPQSCSSVQTSCCCEGCSVQFSFASTARVHGTHFPGGDWSHCKSQVRSGWHPRAQGRDRNRNRPPETPQHHCLPHGLFCFAMVLGRKWSSICRARFVLALHQPWPCTIPHLPSAEAPAVLAWSSELPAKPAMESAALARWELIPVSREHSLPPHPPSKQLGMGLRCGEGHGRLRLCRAVPASRCLCGAMAVPGSSRVTLQMPMSVPVEAAPSH